MKLRKENSNEIENSDMIYLSNIIPQNDHLNKNKNIYQKYPKNLPYQSKIQRASYTSGISTKPQSKYTPSKSYIENIRYNQTPSIKEEPQIANEMMQKVLKSEQPVTQTYYEKRVVKTITTSSHPINNIIEHDNDDNDNIYNTNIKSSNISNYNTDPILKNSNSYQSFQRKSFKDNFENKNTPIKKDNDFNNSSSNYYNKSVKNYAKYLNKKVDEYKNFDNYKNVIHIQSGYSNNIDLNDSSNININKSKMRYSQKIPPLPKKVFSSNNYNNNDYTILSNRLLNRGKKTSLSPTNYQRTAFSPRINDLRRKTINRGNPVKNIQITHIIDSSHPYKFNIMENLNTDYLNTEPLRITQTERIKLKKSGKSSWSTSVQEHIKPIKTNLKGRTTIYQHARGIGMTNDKKENINPLFYNSEIRKLDPIIKEKQKEKVEYMTFRNESGFNSSRATYNNRINYNTNYNNYNTNDNIRNSTGYNRGFIINNEDDNNKSEIIKDTRTKIQIGNRSQYKNQGNPVITLKKERKVYNNNKYIKK